MPDTTLDRADLLGVLIEALTGDDLSQANDDVLEAARKVRDYFEAQGIEVRRGPSRPWLCMCRVCMFTRMLVRRAEKAGATA